MRVEEYRSYADYLLIGQHTAEACGGVVDEEEMRRVWEWVDHATLNAALLALALQGRLSIRWDADSDEPTFGNVQKTGEK